MKGWARWLAPAFVGAAAFVLTMTAGTAVAKQDGRPVDRVVMFASDGMRPDLMERYAKAGFMPTYTNLMKDGVTGKNGMVQAFPPNTGVGWYTMATGTYPSEHGSTNNTFFRGGDAFANRTSFSAAGVLQADTIANAAERAGKKVLFVEPCSDGYVPVAIVYQPTPVLGGKAWTIPFAPVTPSFIKFL